MRTTIVNTNTRFQVERVTMTNILVENELNVDKIRESEGFRNFNNPTDSIDKEDDIVVGPGKLGTKEYTSIPYWKLFLQNFALMPLYIFLITISRRH